MIINIPNRIKSDGNGFEELVTIHHKTKSLFLETITFDFSRCKWFEANLCAVLGAICDNALNNLNEIEFINFKPQIKTIFCKNEFLKHFGGEISIDINHTTVKYKRYSPKEQSSFRDYLDAELLSKEEMPQMSLLLKKKINESIFEIFENAITHGKSDFVFSCGQFYPNKQPPRIDFTIVDLGKTIKANVNNFLNEDLNACNSIKWAVKDKNTTKQGDTPGGLGLKVIQKFLSLNKGKFQIVSDNGYWYQDENNRTFAKLFDNTFIGTIVNLEFNIDDDSVYMLEEEIINLKDEDLF